MSFQFQITLPPPSNGFALVPVIITRNIIISNIFFTFFFFLMYCYQNCQRYRKYIGYIICSIFCSSSLSNIIVLSLKPWVGLQFFLLNLPWVGLLFLTESALSGLVVFDSMCLEPACSCWLNLLWVALRFLAQSVLSGISVFGSICLDWFL